MHEQLLARSAEDNDINTTATCLALTWDRRGAETFAAAAATSEFHLLSFQDVRNCWGHPNRHRARQGRQARRRGGGRGDQDTALSQASCAICRVVA
eukprot:15478974-Alexandrium_andersonii.AAC.1